MRSAASMLCRGDSELKYPIATNEKKESNRRPITEYYLGCFTRELVLVKGSNPSHENSPKTRTFSDFSRDRIQNHIVDDLPHCDRFSLLGFAYSKISQDLSSNRGARDVITQPYR